jgi:hypothetical protein
MGWPGPSHYEVQNLYYTFFTLLLYQQYQEGRNFLVRLDGHLEVS